MPKRESSGEVSWPVRVVAAYPKPGKDPISMFVTVPGAP